MAEAYSEFRHKTPAALKATLDAEPALAAKWAGLTELARNEWICWTSSPKLQETRDAHLVRLRQEVLDGKRRPCCWPGCPHRRASSAKYLKA